MRNFVFLLILSVFLLGCTQTIPSNQSASNQSTQETNVTDETNIDYTPSYEIFFYAPETLYPDAVVGVPYKYSFCNPEPTNVNDLCGSLEDAENPWGGHYPYHFTLGSGVGFQPLGLILNLNGLLTGTPTVAGEKTFEVCAVDLDGNQACGNVTLNVIPSYELAIHSTGTGSGTVSVTTGFREDAKSLTCGNDCSFSFKDGTFLMINATADDGSAFTEWTGDCSGNYGTCTVDAESDMQVTADFEKYSASVTSATCNYDRSTGYEYRIRISGTATGPKDAEVSFDIGDAGGFLGYEDNCGSWASDTFSCKNAGPYGSTSWSWTYTRAQPNSNNWGTDTPFDYPVSVGVRVGINAHQDIPLVIRCS